jgi:phospholipid:diacylglycerol acyltransferase
MEALLHVAGDEFREKVQLWGAVHADPCSARKDKDPQHEFLNPLKDPLPNAPSMNIYCLYGVDAPAERNYYYMKLNSTSELEQEMKDSNDTSDDMLWKIDITEEREGVSVSQGVAKSDGDGTVPLISMGVMCQRGWRTPKLNPQGLRVVSREFPHSPSQSYLDLRQGPRSSEHVDILANVDVMTDVLKIAAGYGHKLKDNITSNIADIAAEIHCFD